MGGWMNSVVVELPFCLFPTLVCSPAMLFLFFAGPQYVAYDDVLYVGIIGAGENS